MAQKPLLWVEVGAHAVRYRPKCGGVVWAGAAVAWRLGVCVCVVWFVFVRVFGLRIVGEPWRGPGTFPKARQRIAIPKITGGDATDPRVLGASSRLPRIPPSMLLCVTGMTTVYLLRFRGGGVLGTHRHPGPVHAHALKGSWGYKGHGWYASVGTYVLEPPGETHTRRNGGNVSCHRCADLR